MARTKPELIKLAEAQGIDTEGLTVAQLRAALGKTDSTDDKSKGKEEAAKESKEPNNSKELVVEDFQDEEEVPASAKASIERQLAAKKLREKNRKKLAKEEKARKAQLDAEKSEAEKSGTTKKKDNRPVFTDDRGLKFRFKKTAPNTLNIDGQSRPITELIKDETVMLELVHGSCNFLEQIYT